MWVVLVVVVVEVDCVGGCASEAFRRPPTGQGGHLPPGEVSPLAGGQSPITLEYQIYPPTIDTLATGMDARKVVGKPKMAEKFQGNLSDVV